MRSSRKARIARQFERRSWWWDRIYEQTSLEAQILRRRQQVALTWIEQLGLPAGSPVLEVGCGAGGTAVELARRGHLVAALDRCPAMLERTRAHAVTSGVDDRIMAVPGDAHQLEFPTETFDLVLALGVLSWLEEPNTAIKEMARVTRPDGHVLVTSLNSLDLARLIDPRQTPLLAPVRSTARLAAAGLGRPRRDLVRPTRHLSWSVRRQLRRSGLLPIRQATVGFGPFTFLGRTLLSGNHAIRVDQALQHPADHNSKLLRSSGRLHLILALKPGPAESNPPLVSSSRISPRADCVQGIPMTPSAIRDVHAVLSGAFKQAMVWGWISHNPVPLTTPPAVEPPDTRRPEVGQAERLIETAMAEDPELGLFLILAVVLGARRGKLCSLRWSDVDFDQGDVLVAGSVIILPGQPLLDRDVTKTRTKRRVAVGAGTLELLRARRVEQVKAALAAGVALGPDAYVSAVRRTAPRPSALTGCPIGSPSWRAGWGSTVGCTICGTSWSPSSLRPGWTCGPSRAGHRDGGRTTLGTYAHFQAARDRQAAELMERLLRLPAAGAP
jgi:ubiquinone/menaquinone biosynthesis C-methylase UbiE/integrase